jgi:hypothetical protein
VLPLPYEPPWCVSAFVPVSVEASWLVDANHEVGLMAGSVGSSSSPPEYQARVIRYFITALLNRRLRLAANPSRLFEADEAEVWQRPVDTCGETDKPRPHMGSQ